MDNNLHHHRCKIKDNYVLDATSLVITLSIVLHRSAIAVNLLVTLETNVQHLEVTPQEEMVNLKEKCAEIVAFATTPPDNAITQASADFVA
jgi:hypothetical protein